MIGNNGLITNIYEEVKEIENHLHNRERWFGLAAVPDAELHRFDLMNGSIQPFQLVAGNNDFGNWVQIIGSTDTPIDAGMTKVDGHRFMVVGTNSTLPFIIQFSFGESAGLAAAVAAGNYTMTPYVAATNNIETGISEILSMRQDSGTKVWSRCACVGGNGTTIDLYIGVHEYLE